MNIDEPEEEVALAIAKQACTELERTYTERIAALERDILELRQALPQKPLEGE